MTLRTVVRKSLALGVLCLFAFAKLAFAAQFCTFTSGECLPAIFAAHAHERHGAHGSEACMMQALSPEAGNAAVTSDHAADVPRLPVADELTVPLPSKQSPRTYVAPVAAFTSPLLASGRLRL